VRMHVRYARQLGTLQRRGMATRIYCYAVCGDAADQREGLQTCDPYYM